MNIKEVENSFEYIQRKCLHLRFLLTSTLCKSQGHDILSRNMQLKDLEQDRQSKKNCFEAYIREEIFVYDVIL